MMDSPDPAPNEGKFSADDVADLRVELMQSGLDSWQAAELIASFLAARGYGISPVEARQALSRIDTSHSSLATMREELEQLALLT